MTEFVLAGSTEYDDVKIIHILEACVIVLQLNVQRGTPRGGQIIKIIISCNQNQEKTCELE